MHYYHVPKKKTKLRIVGPSPTLVYPCGFFDEVAADCKGGVGFFLALNESHSLNFTMDCGLSTNTKAKLLALWALLDVAVDLGIPSLNIFGDSAVIINWEKCHASLDPPDLSHWCMDTRRLISCFLHLSFSHTYREHNQLANRLSKYGLSLAPRCGNFSEILDCHLASSDTFHLF